MILESNLVPSASTSESKVFYLKMKGDYHWYMAEFKVGDERKEAVEDTMNSYKVAQNFFKKHGIAVMTIRELFDFIVDPSINDDSVDSYLEKAQQKILARGDVISVVDEIADSVVVQSYIPKTLDDVKHAEEDVQRIISGKDTGDMYYQTIMGLKHLAKAQPSPAKEQLQQEGDLIPVPPTAPSGHSSSHEIESEDETDEGEDSLTDSEGYVSNVSCHGPIPVQLEL